MRAGSSPPGGRWRSFGTGVVSGADDEENCLDTCRAHHPIDAGFASCSVGNSIWTIVRSTTRYQPEELSEWRLDLGGGTSSRCSHQRVSPVAVSVSHARVHRRRHSPAGGRPARDSRATRRASLWKLCKPPRCGWRSTRRLHGPVLARVLAW